MIIDAYSCEAASGGTSPSPSCSPPESFIQSRTRVFSIGIGARLATP